MLHDALAAGAPAGRPPRSRRHRRRGLRRRRGDVSGLALSARLLTTATRSCSLGSSTARIGRGICSRGRQSRWPGTSPRRTRSATSAGDFGRRLSMACARRSSACAHGAPRSSTQARCCATADRRRADLAPTRRTTTTSATPTSPTSSTSGCAARCASVHPDLLSTMLVPKAEELVANPYRHDGKDGAKEFFEDGFRRRVRARPRDRARRLPDHRLLRVQAVRRRRRRRRRRRAGRRCSTG